ncbi:MAG: hypothetical protein A2204_00435 [Elusimicrobia bacterium RIFOXYA1_FULL_47_7]|nr:MAG: hypothetical protein A2278_02705 [Elusimicrobia bacterium RIFOXYA12_FULL_49_49]OGS09972.1 MAG: hypothetical protein A2386_06260 [Elusimicrobia bacterium RIFOXYB1_FULL_48_9]OGS10293.1 MAG: hypothetical protein A2204_00435 [Elusimicrobia bacterium RIFOXYA1_FULL_47_7]OGS16391.1 MAG: hypothetical protein A2251_06160 [Elusimicrobia bacterium RIFOXYA2_FULL_47_53]OGS27232.1 MAG: hypothetical protein A2339_08020 [Elusimicrobia bacterium RIFOXYB12_FULL_50_12]OGS30432.1 MAG: hypothetical protein
MKRFFAVILALLCLYGTAGASARSKVNRGNKFYNKNQYEKSLDSYREAQVEAPGEPVVHYNIGNALYKSDNLEEAAREFTAASAAKNKMIKSKALYNLGNAAFKMEKTDEAVEHYKNALRLNPKDEDAKYNLEYLLTRQYKKNEKQKQDKDKQQKGKDKNKEDKDKGKPSEQNSEQKQESGGNKKDKQQMSKEDAQRLLNVFEQSDRDSAKKRKMALPQIPEVEEDW